MGLFSSKTITQVGTSVSRVIEDARVPNSIANGVAKNLFSDDDQMIGYVMDEVANSIGLRATRMHNFGKTKYVFGLPSSTLKTSSAGKEAALAAIRLEYGNDAQLGYYHFAPFNYLHYGWQTLVDSYGYDSVSNQLGTLTTLHGTPVFLADMQVCVTPATKAILPDGDMDQWGTPPNAGVTSLNTAQQQIMALIGGMKPATQLMVDAAATSDYVKVSVVYTATEEGKQVQKTETFNLTIPVHDDAAEFHQAQYTLNGKLHYWTYAPNTGTHPAVDTVFNTTYADGGEFFPIVYFRYNKTPGNKFPDSQEYKDSVKLCDYIGMDYEALTVAIDQNPDIKDVEQAMMTLSVPADTTNELERRYLFDFFSGIADEYVPQGHTDAWEGLHVLAERMQGPVDHGSIIIQDKRFKMALSYANIVRHRIAGSIGKIGSHASGYSGKDNGDEHYYQRQIADGVLMEIRIKNLRMTYWVFEQYTTVGDDTDKILLIPLNLNITKDYSIPDREDLYARSLHYVFNSRSVTEVKWYQQGWFAALIAVIAIVIAVFTMQPEVINLAADLVAIFAITGTVALIMAFTLLMVENLIISMAVKYFVQKVGGKTAILVAIIAAIAAGVQIYEAGGSIKNAPWAKELLQATSTLSNAASKQISADIQDLIGEYTEFEHYVEEQTKTLDDAKALLETSMHLNPLIVFGETPTEFYHRTVHSGNIGILGIDIIENYADLALSLPKLTDTLGGYP